MNKGIGFTGILTIVFIVLKLTRVITWGWIWVLSPIWVELFIILVVAFSWRYYMISGGIFTGLYLVILGLYFYKEPFKELLKL